ncbi:hypothetical protein [Roseovarius aestuariivivens]|uniref:hypothetical protein n=1 Tax=Roseovarius aestuariivivens TaxID=1888910 RepID=UPI0010809D77|nr:hypothetical protein [Roseovarius aestuariivivens]
MSEPYVVLHGGFHKTATSHIQSMLGRNTGYLKRQGVLYVHHRDMRKQLTVPCQLYIYAQNGKNYRTTYNDEELAEKTGAFFDGLIGKKDKIDRVILSDENLAGHCGHCVRRGLLYLWRDELIGAIASQIPWTVREVHLGLRNYADFFASAYVEYLRSVTSEHFTDETVMRKRVLEHMPNWMKVLKVVRKHFPEARIVVWRYEDFRQLDMQVLSNLCGPGVDISKLKPPKDKNKRPTASGKAVAELLQMIHRDGAEAALEQRVALQEKYPRGAEYGNYDPWTPSERAHLTRMYDRDVADIRASSDITLVELEHAESR